MFGWQMHANTYKSILLFGYKHMFWKQRQECVKIYGFTTITWNWAAILLQADEWAHEYAHMQTQCTNGETSVEAKWHFRCSILAVGELFCFVCVFPHTFFDFRFTFVRNIHVAWRALCWTIALPNRKFSSRISSFCVRCFG